MKWYSLVAIYFVVWWTVLFVALPFGVRQQAAPLLLLDALADPAHHGLDVHAARGDVGHRPSGTGAPAAV